MKVIKNEKRIKRNVQIGQWTSLAGMLLMGGALYGLFITRNSPELINYPIIATAVGLILTFFSSNLGNRYGGTPRLDEVVDSGLKGLPGEFTLYHFVTPASHLLVGPAGLWVLLPYRQVGKVEYINKRWRLSGGGFLHAYMRFFGQDRLGRPELDAEAETKSLRLALSKHMNEEEIPPIHSMLIFTDPKIEIEANDSPIPAMRLEQIKTFFRQKAREAELKSPLLETIKGYLPAE